MNDKLFAALQYLVPQHGLSRAAGWLANCRWPMVKNPFIRWFVRRYEVDMSQALEEDPCAYEHFNAFFTRALKPEARPLDPDPQSLLCPADGTVSQLGRIEHGRIFQAKGQSYSLQELLGADAAQAEQFDQGHFATIYLSPRDYHRVHMPLSGSLQQMAVVPGDLFSVNEATTREVPRLFARNERAVTVFDTEAGPMAVILVGAMIVAGIDTVWAGQVTPLRRTIIRHHYGAQAPVTLTRGDEMGRFKLGSTVIVLLGKDSVRWAEGLEAGSKTVMGQSLGRVSPASGG